jgi:hypothetical protein
MPYFTCMKETAASLAFVSCVVLVQATLARAQGRPLTPHQARQNGRPTKENSTIAK